MLNVIKLTLKQLLIDLDSGNSNISETEQKELINIINKINTKELSKIQSAEYLGVCRATFDNYINKGLIPKGSKRQGFKELFWNKFDLDNYLNNK